MNCFNRYQSLKSRELRNNTTTQFQRSNHITTDLLQRIGLEKELKGHHGCVNCLEWSEDGRILASGSDDVSIILWQPHSHKRLRTIDSDHTGNIFSVKFLPNSNNNILVSGAGDCKVKVHDVEAKEIRHVFGCHHGRVKRLAVAPNIPYMFWSAAEDGTVMQFDLRDTTNTRGGPPRNALINLNAHMGQAAEVKCIAINPLQTHQLAVGASDAYIRLFDRRMLSCKPVNFYHVENTIFNGDNFNTPDSAGQYFVPGHIPHDPKQKRKLFASTYLTFSPDGSELLVNLGGEQIYIFDVNRTQQPLRYKLPSASNNHKKDSHHHTNGINLTATTNGVHHHILSNLDTTDMEDSDMATDHKPLNITNKKSHSSVLPAMVQKLKDKANSLYKNEKYVQAIYLYNQAIHIAPNYPVLYSNRAAAYLKRRWDGDLYSALRDCHIAISLDPEYIKGYFRLSRCLYELGWCQEAHQWLQHFKQTFPDCDKFKAFKELQSKVKKDLGLLPSDKNNQDSTSNSSSSNSSSSGSDTGDNSNKATLAEKNWRKSALDYSKRFCGHCNTTTDIKEANFFGSNGQYIAAGSDDGSFFIWERSTCNIVRVLRGDESIVNCIQPHPTNCMLATSGIESVVRLWSPRPEDDSKNDREISNLEDAATANQKRMNADPLAVMLMNMGYSMVSGGEGYNYVDGEGESPPACRTT